ncbi:hypothetical protein EV197_2567 [Aquimarina brevivitae]|uniref:Uncharacterized protein n=1 Tax=Aquimarina brevivitae TaxID=323412 RepID=A0A4Q7P2I5_9FLAO|nr:hypothetical protein EV197_2567 [Aquimarina brevivitae]
MLLISIFTACASLKSDPFVDGQMELTKHNLYALNGKYTRNPVHHTKTHKGDLFWNFYTRGYNVGADSLCAVALKVIDEKQLNVTIMKKDSLIKSRILKGKLKNGYFEMKRRVLFIPSIFLNVFRTSKFRIGLLENGNLTTDFKQIAWGTGFVIIPFYNKKKEFNVEYAKIDRDKKITAKPVPN